MSSSTDDELGTSKVSKTPRVAKSSNKVRASKAGPESQMKARRGQHTRADSTRGTKEEPLDVEASDEDPPQTIQRPRKKAESLPTNAPRSTKGKARGTNRPPAPSRTEKPVASDVMELEDEDENLANDMDEDIAPQIAQAINAASGSSQRATKAKPTPDATKLQKELAEARTEINSLKAKASALEKDNEFQRTQCETLRMQLDELSALRHTEAEKLLEEQTQHFEARLETQQKTIQELTSNLARVEPLSRSGSVLHLLTRDAADEEKRLLEEDIKRLKDGLAEKEAIISKNNQWREEKLQEEKELRYELKLQQEALAKNKTAKSTRVSSNDPKPTAVVSFYEDLTDIAVVNIDHIGQPKRPDQDEWLLSCVYTHSDGVKMKGYALHFTLRSEWIPPTGENPPFASNQFMQKLHYTPLSLDNEKPEFVEKLEFLKSPFTFERTQLPVFLRTLRETITDAIDPPSDDGDASGTAIEIDD